MASVAFRKIHTAFEFKLIARHCDKDMRLHDNHRNKDIRKELTHLNTQLPDRPYDVVCSMYDRKIAELDRIKGANKRQDRVTGFALEIPAPLDIRESDKAKWFQEVYTLICAQYDYRNVVQYYVHYDEVHDYLHAENGMKKTSRVHAHCLVIPEHEGKLNGKWFSSRPNMIKLNNDIHAMTASNFGVEFMDGTKRGSTKRVEQLKRLSASKKYEKEIMEKKQELVDLGLAIDHFDEIIKLGTERWKELHPEDGAVNDDDIKKIQ